MLSDYNYLVPEKLPLYSLDCLWIVPLLGKAALELDVSYRILEIYDK